MVLSSATTVVQSADTTERFTKRIFKCGKVFIERQRERDGERDRKVQNYWRKWKWTRIFKISSRQWRDNALAKRCKIITKQKKFSI